ncbi:cytochrome b-561 domain containing 2 [Nannochloropsis gaditana]|uniref:Cytochrome b-561 domain containing 2 n=1 Tax=Nannochloropsis gaditana TaxID=72520 RepID=W7TVJ0_9STRA|nr:cytochrome b-561 domain containing 2 [Nannochloropsis gaditana]
MVTSWLFFAPLSWSLILARGTTMIKAKRILLTQLHAASMFLAVVCWIAALLSIFMHKHNLNKEHFTSSHSMVGASVFVLVLLSYASAFYNVVDVRTKEIKFNWNSKIHKTLGKAALVASGFAISTGLFTRWGKTTFEDKNVRIGLALCIIVPQVVVALDVMARFAGHKNERKGS